MPARTVRGPGPLRPVADGARPIVPPALAAFLAVSAERATSLRAENERLVDKLARLSSAIQGLASELAASRRECRRRQLEIDALRSENATLREAAYALGTPAASAEATSDASSSSTPIPASSASPRS